MGREASYQAVPEECGLIERARTDVPFGELLQCFVIWLSRWGEPGAHPLSREPGVEDLWWFARDLVLDYPTLPTRHLDLDRTWDKLHYLLSAERRGHSAGPCDQILTRAIRGGDPIGEHVLAGQGAPLCYLRPSEVNTAAGILDRLTEADLRTHYDPVAMHAGAVYKFDPDAAEADWPWIVENFHALRRFYRVVAEYDEGVLFLLD